MRFDFYNSRTNFFLEEVDMQDPNTTYDNLRGETNALDRAWAATRPADLSPSTTDEIWTKIEAGLDASTVYSMADSAAWSRKKLVLALVGLAQAAAVIIAIWIVNRPVSMDKPLVPVQVAKVQPASFDLENDETLVVSIDGSVIANRLVVSTDSQSLALNDLPATDHYRALSSMESLSHE
jgi:hypothetical protein